VAEKAVDLNKDISSFHERLFLIALGTVGLSVTALISLGPKFSSSPAARLTFIHYVAPAWILLLLSAWASRNVMMFMLRINKGILEEWMKRIDSYHLQEVGISISKLSKALSGKIVVESKLQDVSALFGEAGKAIREAANQNIPPLKSTLEADQKRSKRRSVIAVWSMQIALVLLGIAAIRLFLLP
jgi:hypothetical protein